MQGCEKNMADNPSCGLATKTLLIIPSALIVFHICNLFGLIPLNIVWMGSITSDKTMLLMGSVSILINAAMVFIALVKCRYISQRWALSITEKFLPIMFWWLVGNTVANVFSNSMFEVVVFTPILILLTLCCYKVWKAVPSAK